MAPTQKVGRSSKNKMEKGMDAIFIAKLDGMPDFYIFWNFIF